MALKEDMLHRINFLHPILTETSLDLLLTKRARSNQC